jgi:hypothetical protein
MSRNNAAKAPRTPRSTTPEGGETNDSLAHRERILEFNRIAQPFQIHLGGLGALAVGLFSHLDCP